MNQAKAGHTLFAEYITMLQPNFANVPAQNPEAGEDLFQNLGEEGANFEERINNAASPEERMNQAQAIIQVNVRNRNEQDLDNMYNNLTDVVVWQGLLNHSQYGKPVLQGIALNENVYEEFKAKTKNYLKEKRVLENGKLKDLFRKIENGQFSKEVMDKLSIRAAEEERLAELARQAEAARLAAQNAGLQNQQAQNVQPAVQEANPQAGPVPVQQVVQQPNLQANINLGQILLNENEQQIEANNIEQKNNQPLIEEEVLSPSEYYDLVQSSGKHLRKRAAGRIHHAEKEDSEW